MENPDLSATVQKKQEVFTDYFCSVFGKRPHDIVWQLQFFPLIYRSDLIITIISEGTITSDSIVFIYSLTSNLKRNPSAAQGIFLSKHKEEEKKNKQSPDTAVIGAT